MATSQMIKVQSESETTQIEGTWSSVFPQSVETIEKSLIFVKKLVAVGISSITYLKMIFPDAAYVDKYLEGLNLKILTENSGFVGVDKLISWIDSCFEAIQLKYLQEMTLILQEKPDDPNTALESYTFKFKYTKAGEVELSQLNSQKVKQDRKFEIRKPTIKMIRTIILLMEGLDQLPDKVFLKMHLKYNQQAPRDYEPKGFQMSTEADFRYKNRVNFRVGQIETPFHSLKLRLCTEQKRFFGGDDDEDAEHDIAAQNNDFGDSQIDAVESEFNGGGVAQNNDLETQLKDVGVAQNNDVEMRDADFPEPELILNDHSLNNVQNCSNSALQKEPSLDSQNFSGIHSKPNESQHFYRSQNHAKSSCASQDSNLIVPCILIDSAKSIDGASEDGVVPQMCKKLERIQTDDSEAINLGHIGENSQNVLAMDCSAEVLNHSQTQKIHSAENNLVKWRSSSNRRRMLSTNSSTGNSNLDESKSFGELEINNGRPCTPYPALEIDVSAALPVFQKNEHSSFLNENENCSATYSAERSNRGAPSSAGRTPKRGALRSAGRTPRTRALHSGKTPNVGEMHSSRTPSRRTLHSAGRTPRRKLQTLQRSQLRTPIFSAPEAKTPLLSEGFSLPRSAPGSVCSIRSVSLSLAPTCNKEYPVRCPCLINVDDGIMIMCDVCGFWQHAACFAILEECDAPSKHYCEQCADPPDLCTDPRLFWGDPIQVRGTCLYRRALVSLKGQKTEITSAWLAQMLSVDISLGNGLVNKLKQEKILVRKEENDGVDIFKVDSKTLLNIAYPNFFNRSFSHFTSSAEFHSSPGVTQTIESTQCVSALSQFSFISLDADENGGKDVEKFNGPVQKNTFQVDNMMSLGDENASKGDSLSILCEKNSSKLDNFNNSPTKDTPNFEIYPSCSGEALMGTKNSFTLENSQNIPPKNESQNSQNLQKDLEKILSENPLPGDDDFDLLASTQSSRNIFISDPKPVVEPKPLEAKSSSKFKKLGPKKGLKKINSKKPKKNLTENRNSARQENELVQANKPEILSNKENSSKKRQILKVLTENSSDDNEQRDESSSLNGANIEFTSKDRVEETKSNYAKKRKLYDTKKMFLV